MSMTGRFQRVTDTEIDALLAAPEGIVDFLLGDDVRPDLDIEKSWHAIHFFLNGDAWEGRAPLDFIVRGGTDIGTEEVVYGPARAFRSDEVRAIWRALEPIEVSQVRGAYDAARMRELEIYPDGWVSAEVDHLDDYFMPYFVELRTFLAETTSRGQGMIAYLA